MLKVESAGSCTMEWFINTFDERILNSIYISGNPYIGNYRNVFSGVEYDPRLIFDRVRDAYMDAWGKVNDVYVMRPDVITKIAIINMRLKPRRRTIIHYMQPHAPYPFASDLRKYFVDDMNKPDMRLWDALERGEVKPERAREAYRETLIWILGIVLDIPRLVRRRKIVITSDHGECFGEHGLYNHPCGKRVKELIEVPWCVITT